jgi:TolA-binding protein
VIEAYCASGKSRALMLTNSPKKINDDSKINLLNLINQMDGQIVNLTKEVEKLQESLYQEIDARMKLESQLQLPEFIN